MTGSAAPVWPPDDALLAALAPWMAQRRWYPLKDEGPASEQDLRIVASHRPAPRVRDLLVAVSGPGRDDVLVHVPLVLEEAGALARHRVEGEAPGGEGLTVAGPGGEVALVDGPHHPDFWRAWARAAAKAGTVLGARGARAVEERADRLRVTTGEQSNTSVVLPAAQPGRPPGDSGDPADGDLIVKVFRVLAPGRNPDVEVSVALAGDGWDRVRTPVAWSTLAWRDPGDGRDLEADSAVACTFVPRADDGFELFSSLAADDDGPGAPVRTRALALAADLGATTARMHHHLARSLGTCEPPAPGGPARDLRRRARWATTEVPELLEHIPGLADAVHAALSDLEALPRLDAATRIHGDYHLGQVLHEIVDEGEGRWFVLDFEGEPLRPLAERREPDQPLRDVAGMLRSFDYAAAVGGARHGDWLDAVRGVFLSAYDAARPGRDADGRRVRDVLLRALELDKALYEAVYEARNRPDWLGIPLRGLHRLVRSPDTP